MLQPFKEKVKHFECLRVCFCFFFLNIITDLTDSTKQIKATFVLRKVLFKISNFTLQICQIFVGNLPVKAKNNCLQAQESTHCAALGFGNIESSCPPSLFFIQDQIFRNRGDRFIFNRRHNSLFYSPFFCFNRGRRNLFPGKNRDRLESSHISCDMDLKPLKCLHVFAYHGDLLLIRHILGSNNLLQTMVQSKQKLDGAGMCIRLAGINIFGNLFQRLDVHQVDLFSSPDVT